MSNEFRMLSYDIRLPGKLTQPIKVFQMTVTWLKIKYALDTHFPEARESSLYRKLILFGMNDMWSDTWMAELQHASNLSRESASNKMHWAALILWRLWCIWPRISKALSTDQQWLIAASRALDGNNKSTYALGVAINNKNPKRLIGQVDVMPVNEDTVETREWAALWAQRS